MKDADPMKPHLKVICFPNRCIRHFCVTQEVTPNRCIYGFGDDVYTGSSCSKQKAVGALAKELACDLLRLPGVVGGHLSQYECSVTIADAFDWEDVGPLVVGLIVSTMYPEVNGDVVAVSTATVDKRDVPVAFGSGRPVLDIEAMVTGRKLGALATLP